VILKECFPGLVNFNGRTEPPWTWEHYAAAPDAPDEDGVEERFWVFLLSLSSYFELELYLLN
jgi:hypothetical protein